MFAILYGSVRDNRKGIRAARFFTSYVRAQKLEAELVDPLDFDLGLLNKRVIDYEEGEQLPEPLARLRDILRRAEGFIVVTAEYNASLPPALTNMIDHFGPDEFARKAVGIVSYSGGRYGGTRSSQQVRTIMPQLGAITVPYGVSIPNVADQFEEDGTAKVDVWPAEAQKLLDQLLFWTGRAKSQA